MTKTRDFFPSQPYAEDVPLLKRLGLDVLKEYARDEQYIGQTNGGVKVWVSALPAQFYRFEIPAGGDAHAYTIATGSGKLSTYWPMIDALAEGMLVVKMAAGITIPDKYPA